MVSKILTENTYKSIFASVMDEVKLLDNTYVTFESN